MFKHAYCRGIQLALIQSGVASYADGSDAVKVADYVAERVEFDPTSVTPETTRKIAGHLVEASREIQKASPNFKAASFNKLANWDEVHKLASDNAVQLMEAAEKRAEGSTIEGGDKGNAEGQSPAGETKMDTAQRPEGYATDSLGKSDVDTRPGAVGKEQEQPNKPAESPSKDNSVQEQSRTASLADLMRKIAEGSTILGGDKGNKEMSSAEAKMDATQRPAGYASLPTQGALGQLMSQVKGPAVVGRETTHPNAPAESPDGTNSVQQHSAKAAEDAAFMSIFKKTASECVPYMPADFTDAEKIAHTRACMGMTTEEKASYLKGLQKQAQERVAAAPAQVPPGSRGDNYAQHNPDATHSRPGAYDGRHGNQGKTAELPDFIREKMEGKKDEGGDKDKDDKKDENPFAKKDENPFAKKDDDKGESKGEEKEKEAAMRAHLSRIHDAMRAGAQR